jgi:hypothetical protein
MDSHLASGLRYSSRTWEEKILPIKLVSRLPTKCPTVITRFEILRIKGAGFSFKNNKLSAFEPISTG